MDGAPSWELFIGAPFIGAYGCSMVLPNLADFLLRNYNICTEHFETVIKKKTYLQC